MKEMPKKTTQFFGVNIVGMKKNFQDITLDSTLTRLLKGHIVYEVRLWSQSLA